MAEGDPPPPSRQIRAVHDDGTVRVYQAYNDAIADAAISAQTFRAPLDLGLWSKSRMTWIKPSKVWMAYRCGWTVIKDENQSRVLALDIARPKFEELLMQATVTSHEGGRGRGGRCRDSSVVVQWDPERAMCSTSSGKNVFTESMGSVRSIQIGLRGPAVEALLDPRAVTRITDVTGDFKNALRALRDGDEETAAALLWPDGEEERILEVPRTVRDALGMDGGGGGDSGGGEGLAPAATKDAGPSRDEKLAVVVLGSAANPPHRGHFHCLDVGKRTAENMGYRVLFATIAAAPGGYVRKKMGANETGGGEGASDFVLPDEARLRLVLIVSESAADVLFQWSDRCHGSALECGRRMRPSDDVAVAVVVGGDRCKAKWRRKPKADQITICCARDEGHLSELKELYEADRKEGLVLDEGYHFAAGVGPPTSSTGILSILQSDWDRLPLLLEQGYSREAAEYLLTFCQH